MDNSNKPIVLITGSSRGIGRGLAESFLKKGGLVLGLSRSESDLCHNNYKHFAVDITDFKEVTSLISDIEKEFGRLDILVNNAGSYLSSHTFMTPVEDVQSLIDVNFLAAYHVCREAAKVMMKRKFGRIVNISSIATAMMSECTAAYTVSKAALVNFTKVFAKEVSEFGITCNAVGVSIIDTDIVKTLPDNVKQRVLSYLTIKRYATIGDIYKTISFFTSSDNDYVTGQVINLGYVD